MRDRVKRLDGEIAAIALPAAVALATEPLYDLADTAVLGHLGAAPLAGAALAVRLLAFGSAAFIFLMFGTTAAVARRDGAGDPRGAARHGVTAVWLGVGLGLAAMCLAWWWAPTLVDWAGARGDVARDTRTYLTISAAGPLARAPRWPPSR